MSRYIPPHARTREGLKGPMGPVGPVLIAKSQKKAPSVVAEDFPSLSKIKKTATVPITPVAPIWSSESTLEKMREAAARPDYALEEERRDYYLRVSAARTTRILSIMHGEAPPTAEECIDPIAYAKRREYDARIGELLRKEAAGYFDNIPKPSSSASYDDEDDEW